MHIYAKVADEIAPIAITLAVAAVPGGSIAPQHDLCASDSPALFVVIVDHVASAPVTRATAAHEAQDIWARAGLRLVWTSRPGESDSPSTPSPDGPVLLVVIQPTFTHTRLQVINPAKHRGTPLGRVLWTQEGGPANRVEVSLNAVRAQVMSARFHGYDVNALPGGTQDELLGRAMGRVIAHEIGHWLFGPDHASGGLMKETLDDQALIDLHPPSLQSFDASCQGLGNR
jgi:hypothetical protein